MTRWTRQQIAATIDHAALKPNLTDQDIVENCRLGKRYHVASVCVRPSDVALTARELAGSGVVPSAVIGFPHGAHRPEVKALEARLAIEDGAKELDMVMNIGRLLPALQPQPRIQRHRHCRQLGRRVGVGQAAAKGAPRPYLRVGDLCQGGLRQGSHLADERVVLERLGQIEARLADTDDPRQQELRERIARVRGTLTWRLRTEYHERFTLAHQHLQELDTVITAMTQSYESLVRTRQAATHSYVGYDVPITRLRKRVAEALAKVDRLMARQGHMLETVAIKELQAVLTISFSRNPLRATIATRTALMRLRLTSDGLAHVPPVASTQRVMILVVGPSDTPYCA